ncbi:uncharacterized protein PITG_09020 [Phytophthora infestans T30-4]|uniref:FYVE-type domain-containing protein n=1 Tax=Phytophthora infestans (strain T30-4) TaxID=403677 RepID=D0NDR0_PHYIT|nr:uncharacterized protein PITG_09020 [Phytophthora infestans T30-4]EEY56217.1 conserved hypothetical protein [Phytophthora infestans T30-4]|eukprot:XP_002903047.1 conserved hypothetical protein [Phytophthora infestans T30-4]
MDSSMANSTNCANLKHGYNSSADGYIPGKLPLPDDFFPVPQLSSKENKYLLGLAKHACKEVVYYSRQDDGPMKWLHLSSEDGVDVFQGVDNSGTSDTQQDAKALTYLRGSCKIRATIDEISDFFKLDTPEKLSGFAQTVGKDLLDQKTLLTLATPTPDNPKHYVAVKWTAVESPNKLVRPRDFCYIECHDEFIDANTKRRGWVRSIHSIRLPFCPPLNRSHGLVRGSFYRSGYIFTESAEKGCVDAVHTLHVDIKGNAPNWLKILVMKRRIKNIAQVNHHFQLQRLTQEKLLGDLELPGKEGVTHCQLCETRFGLFHRRRLCRKCGKVVCNPCGNEYLLDYARVGAKKVRICLECSESVVYGVSVPMMDGSIRIVDSGVKKLDDSQVRPAYDESMIILENRHHSIDENEFYFENEDVNGLADMEEAKRMNKEFDNNAKSLLGMNSASGETLPVDTPLDDEELGLPPSKSEQMRKQLQYEEQMRREHIERAKKMHQFRSSGVGTGSDPPVRHQPELGSPYTSLSDSNLAGAFTTRRRHRSDDLEDRDDEAFRLAMSAMRLYEEERGASLHVTEETRQAALAKMMEVYAREIERSHNTEDGPYNRGTISDTRRLHHDVGIAPPLRRTVSDDRPPSFYGSPLHKNSEDAHEYRDLSDLTSSAFQAFQMNSLGPRDVPKIPVDRESSSTTHVQLKSDTSGAAYGSVESSEVSNLISRPNSMYGVASDTFSDMDFTDLPHLMRKDDAAGTRSSFTDLQHWTEVPSENGGVEYVPEPWLSDLLSPLHLEGVQHVDDDDSESQSSNASSQLDWQNSMSNPYQDPQITDSESSFVRAYSNNCQNEAESYSDLTNTNNALSASMVTQNDEPPRRQYRKPPSLSELLSEYCDSERSSLPSYLEFGGQAELEPEYLEAIANATNQDDVPVEGGRRGHVRRRSSIPSELEAMTSRELFL